MKRIFAGAMAAVVGLALAGSPAVAQDQLVITADGTSGTASGTGSRTNQDGGTIIFGDITSDGQTTIITAAEPGAQAPAPPPAPVPAPAPEPAPAPSDGGGSDRAVPTETDRDADNYPDASEPDAGLDPDNPDTDADGLADGDEVNIYNTNPTVFDTDGDGLGDGEEEFWTGTDPTDPSDGNMAAEGQTTEGFEEPGPSPSSTAPVASDSAGDPSGSGCSAYADWYAAQTAYEAAGRTEASASIVESLDPDRDGVACESLMEV